MAAAESNTAKECFSCGQALGGMPPNGGEIAVLAKCRGCDHRYYISSETKQSANLALGNQAAFGFKPSRHLSGHCSSTLMSMLTAANTSSEMAERRQQPRYAANSSLVAIPLNSDFQPNAAAFDATCIDISCAGISFSVNSGTEASFWLIDLKPTLGSSVQAMMKIVRMEPLGGTYWKVAGPFVTDLEVATWTS